MRSDHPDGPRPPRRRASPRAPPRPRALVRDLAEETVQQAEGYAAERVNNAEGEAARFTALYNEFVKAPEVTKRRIYLETMSNVIPKIGNVIITDEKGNNVLPLLQMQMNKKTEDNEN